jgi:hypothetical protein
VQSCAMCGNPRPGDASFRDRLLPEQPPSQHHAWGGGGFGDDGDAVGRSTSRINELHAAALGGLAGSALAMLQGSSVTRGAFTGASAGFIGSSLINELDMLSSHLELLRDHMQEGGAAGAGAGAGRVGNGYEELLERFGTGAPVRRTNTETIESMPTRVIATASVLPQEQKNCCICLADFEAGDQAKTLPCFHLFHSVCIDQWLRQSNQCPVCKTNVV